MASGDNTPPTADRNPNWRAVVSTLWPRPAVDNDPCSNMADIYPPAYALEHGRPKLKTSVVAFLDVLGSRVASHAADAQRELDNLYDALTAPRVAELRRRDSWMHAVATFTDNVVIGVPVDERDDAESEISWMSRLVSRYQLELALRGVFIRGGVAIGSLWIGDGFAFGRGLIDAHDLESRQADVPRVILSRDVEDRVRSYTRYYGGADKAPWNNDLVLSIDDKPFVNYLNAPARDELDGVLAGHRDAVAAARFDNCFSLRVTAKYDWLARYHNWFCRQVQPLDDSLLLGDTEPMLYFRSLADDDGT